jgi:RNA polymerase sigma factor (sigma-70 family)
MDNGNTEQLDDRSLMLAVRDGEVARLGDLFERHHERLFAFVYRMTGDRALAEDLVQEVFVRLLKYRHTYRGENSFTTWMFQIARNARVDHFRKQPRRNEISIDDDPREYPSVLPGPVERYQKDEEMNLMLEALSRLSDDKREVLLLRGLHGLKFRELAEVLECSVGAAKGKAFRAIKDLKDALQGVSGGSAR